MLANSSWIVKPLSNNVWMNKFNEEVTKMDVTLYLHSGLAYWDQTWCVL